VHKHETPAAALTDNGMVFTTRLAGGRGGRNALEHELRRLDIEQKNSRPNHPTTCGKVERFQQTMKSATTVSWLPSDVIVSPVPVPAESGAPAKGNDISQP
jgi:transposase InsO family protein